MASKKKEVSEPLTFTQCYKDIEAEVDKRRPRWFLDSVTWMDFDDVKQIILAHISRKFFMWEQDKPLAPWVNKIISNQFHNLLRNNYTNFVRPCLNCPFAMNEASLEGSACGLTNTGSQDSSCPVFAKWERTKKAAYDIKMALPIESHANAVKENFGNVEDIDDAGNRLHAEMEKELNPRQWRVYKLLFIDHLDDEEVAKEMGYKTTESGRPAGYKQIKNLKRQFKERAKKIIRNKDIFYHG